MSVAKERLHTSSQTPKGPNGGVCDEVCSRSAALPTTAPPASGAEKVLPMCVPRSVTHVFASCREGEGGLQLPGTRRFAWHGALISFAQGSRVPRQFASALVCGAFLSPHPSPLPEERENRTPRRRTPTLHLTPGTSLLSSRLP